MGGEDFCLNGAWGEIAKVRVWVIAKEMIMKVMLLRERICDIFLDSTCTGNVSDFAVLPAVMCYIFHLFALYVEGACGKIP